MTTPRVTLAPEDYAPSLTAGALVMREVTMTLANDMPVTAALEAEVRKVMAQRVSLKQTPGTHAEQADLLVDCDYLLDLYIDACVS